MKEENLIIYNPGDPRPESRTDWAKVEARTDEELERLIADDPDDPANDPEFWKHAKIVLPAPKEPVTIRLSPRVLNFFRADGRGYQSRINAILEAYVDAQESRRA